MTEFLRFFIDMCNEIITVTWDSISITIGNVTVTYFWILIAIIGLAMVVSVFWKGARG